MSVTDPDPQAHALIGAYVCDALEPAERAAFERHLVECADCRREVDELREVAAELASAVAAPPPERLHAAVRAQIAAIRQLPPADADVAPIAVPRARRPARRVARAGWAVAAVLAGVVAVLSVVDASQRGTIDAVNVRASSLAALLSAPDVHSAAGQVATGGVATVVVSRGRDEAAVTLSGLAALPAGKAYQLWTIGPSGVRPDGLVPAGAGGSPGTLFTHGLGDARTVALTVEPAQGSAQPTTTPILTLAIPG